MPAKAGIQYSVPLRMGCGVLGPRLRGDDAYGYSSAAITVPRSNSSAMSTMST